MQSQDGYVHSWQKKSEYSKPPPSFTTQQNQIGVVVKEGWSSTRGLIDYFITCALWYSINYTKSFVHTENVFRSALQNAGICFMHNSIGLRWPRFPPTMLYFSWINLRNVSISGVIKPRSENVVQILVATFTLLALVPHSFYFHSILRDRLNLYVSCRPPS